MYVTRNVILPKYKLIFQHHSDQVVSLYEIVLHIKDTVWKQQCTNYKRQKQSPVIS